jgi:excisionase family DNA binding protein
MRERLTMTVDEVAAALGVSRGTAYEAVRSGQVPSIKVGRRVLIPCERFERWLAGDGGGGQ